MTNPDTEGLLIAMEMERRGVELYRHAAQLGKCPEAKALFARLMADEQMHGLAFEAHYREALKRQTDAADDVDHVEYAPAAVESIAYHRAVAAEVIYPEGLVAMGLKTGFGDRSAILKQAIEAEEQSINFYEGMATTTRDATARLTFKKIAEEERRHRQELTEQLKEG